MAYSHTHAHTNGNTYINIAESGRHTRNTEFLRNAHSHGIAQYAISISNTRSNHRDAHAKSRRLRAVFRNHRRTCCGLSSQAIKVNSSTFSGTHLHG